MPNHSHNQHHTSSQVTTTTTTSMTSTGTAGTRYSSGKHQSLYSRILMHPHGARYTYMLSLAAFSAARMLSPLASPYTRAMHVPHALSTRRIDVVVCLVRAGLLLGISFLEAPTKFHAPSLPSRDVALDIGRHVFSALNRVEIVLSAFRITHLVDWSVVPTQLLLLLPAAWTDSFVDRPALIPGGVPGIQMLGNAAMVAVSGGSDSPLVRNAVTVLRPTNILATAILAMAPPVIPNVVPDLIALPLQTFVLMPLLISRAADLIRHGSSTVADGVAMDGNHEETEVPLTGFVDPLAVAERNRRVQLRRRAAVAHLAYAALEVVKVVCLVKHSWRVLVHLSLVL